jgi:hypothetical protein
VLSKFSSSEDSPPQTPPSDEPSPMKELSGRPSSQSASPSSRKGSKRGGMRGWLKVAVNQLRGMDWEEAVVRFLWAFFACSRFFFSFQASESVLFGGAMRSDLSHSSGNARQESRVEHEFDIRCVSGSAAVANAVSFHVGFSRNRGASTGGEALSSKLCSGQNPAGNVCGV